MVIKFDENDLRVFDSSSDNVKKFNKNIKGSITSRMESIHKRK